MLDTPNMEYATSTLDPHIPSAGVGKDQNSLVEEVQVLPHSLNESVSSPHFPVAFEPTVSQRYGVVGHPVMMGTPNPSSFFDTILDTTLYPFGALRSRRGLPFGF
ncbi:hypothetical protein BDP27DRAFT_1430040 [Rhodocollybia butyracea]|uniref:Uncharacterized protein n=1 Tax=Rhodocollybia butyracea TaxID=206335 RepID=A0A9P5PC60_9AGAR|nr:hypothetical protein BDP27DRAFT_1430040 [Rhodocollybia butyracea]